MPNHNNISFKSNIHFVNKKTFNEIKKGFEITVAPKEMIYFGDDFWTKGVRTCTSGAIISDDKSAGFHFIDFTENLHNVPKLASDVLGKISKVKNGLLFGGKAHFIAVNSMKIFKGLKAEFSNAVKNLSVFEQHSYDYSQTHMHYSSKEDTFWLCSEYSKSFKEPIQAVEDLPGLLKFFKNISIAKTDKLFIGDQEITKDKAPHIFAK